MRSETFELPSSLQDLPPSMLAQAFAQSRDEDDELNLDGRALDDEASTVDLNTSNGSGNSTHSPRKSTRHRTGLTRRAKARRDAPTGYGRLYLKTCMTFQMICSCVTTRVSLAVLRFVHVSRIHEGLSASVRRSSTQLWRLCSGYIVRPPTSRGNQSI